tara:strand:+ start:327 stop:620 length:294 start_codon:yes stop_codon:yes gene_type:complete
MTKPNSYEKKMLDQINTLNEGLMDKILGMIYKRGVDRILKKFVNALDGDPEVKAAIANLQQSRKTAADRLKNYCKKNPDSPLCDKKSATYKKLKRYM